MADLLFLLDLCLLLLSAYYTDRTANAIVASQTASVEAGQHSQTCELHQQAGFDRKLSKVNLAEAGAVSKKNLAARTLSRSKSKRDMVFMPGPTGGGMNPSHSCMVPRQDHDLCASHSERQTALPAVMLSCGSSCLDLTTKGPEQSLHVTDASKIVLEKHRHTLAQL